MQREVSRDAAERKLLAQLAEVQAKYREAIRQLAEAEQRADLLAGLGEGTRRTLKKLAAKPGSHTTPILCLMDWHVEERIDADTVDRKNEFNLDIAAARIQRTFQKFVEQLERLRHFARMSEMVLAVLGDIIAGYIHPELIESNYLSPTEATLFAQDHLASGIDFLLREAGMKSIVVPCVHGNHGRTTPHKLVSTGYKNSFEWNMYRNLARLYRNEPRVSFKIENGIHNWLTIQGHDVRFHHGDHIRYQGGVGGISIPVNKKIDRWNKMRVASLDVFGHYHQFMDCWSWVCGGCLVGYNLYAVSVGAEYQEPTQTLIVVSREYGKVMALPIFCG